MAYVQTKISSSDVLVWTDVLQKTNASSSSDVWSSPYVWSWPNVWPWPDARTQRSKILGCIINKQIKKTDPVTYAESAHHNMLFSILERRCIRKKSPKNNFFPTPSFYYKYVPSGTYFYLAAINKEIKKFEYCQKNKKRTVRYILFLIWQLYAIWLNTIATLTVTNLVFVTDRHKKRV